MPIATFDTDLQGLAFLFSSPGALLAASTATFDGTVGQPDPGSALLTIPFVPNADSANSNEQIDFGINFAAMNLSGKTLTARVRLDSGLGAGGAAKLILKSGSNFFYADGGFQNLTAGGDWVTLSMSLDAPAFMAPGYTPTQIVQVAVEIQANGAAAFTTATVHIDTIGYQ